MVNTRSYTADAVLYRQPSGQPTNTIMLNLNWLRVEEVSSSYKKRVLHHPNDLDLDLGLDLDLHLDLDFRHEDHWPYDIHLYDSTSSQWFYTTPMTLTLTLTLVLTLTFISSLILLDFRHEDHWPYDIHLYDSTSSQWFYTTPMTLTLTSTLTLTLSLTLISSLILLDLNLVLNFAWLFFRHYSIIWLYTISTTLTFIIMTIDLDLEHHDPSTTIL